jgi:hypothetical protein
MESPSLVLAISKLVVAGEQAGLTLEQMIDLGGRGGGGCHTVFTINSGSVTVRH